jgi:hypothetical protein
MPRLQSQKATELEKNMLEALTGLESDHYNTIY